MPAASRQAQYSRRLYRLGCEQGNANVGNKPVGQPPWCVGQFVVNVNMNFQEEARSFSLPLLVALFQFDIFSLYSRNVLKNNIKTIEK